MDNGASSYRRFRDTGDENALVEIVHEYRDGLIFYLHSYVENIHIAEELAEDTFVQIGLKRPKDSKKASFKTWLYTIGRNLAISYLRKHPNRSTDSVYELDLLIDEENDLERLYLREERKIAVHQALKKLKPEYRQVLWLIYFEQFTQRDAARVMKKSEGNVATLLHRAKKALKLQLEKDGFVYEEL